MKTIALFLCCALASASAHFTLDAPSSRGFDDDAEGTGPCGGFNTVNTTRTALALTGGQYQIDSHHASAVVSVVLSKDGETFGSTAVQQYTLTGLGTFCGQLGELSGYTAGENVTLQIVYKSSSESSSLYQCADVRLSNTTVTPSTCVNGTGMVASNVKVGSIALDASSSTSSAAAGASASTSAVTTSQTSSAGPASVGVLRSGVALSFAVLAGIASISV